MSYLVWFGTVLDTWPSRDKAPLTNINATYICQCLEVTVQGFVKHWNSKITIELEDFPLQSNNRTDFRLAPSQWQTSLQNNPVSHWLGANIESALFSGSVIWRAPYQQRSPGACQISERYDHYNIQSHGPKFTIFGGKTSYRLVFRSPGYFLNSRVPILIYGINGKSSSSRCPCTWPVMLRQWQSLKLIKVLSLICGLHKNIAKLNPCWLIDSNFQFCLAGITATNHLEAMPENSCKMSWILRRIFLKKLC